MATEIVEYGDKLDNPVDPMQISLIVREVYERHAEVKDAADAFAKRLQTECSNFLSLQEENLGHVWNMVEAHAADVRRVDADHRLEVAQLTAENAFLREKLSVLTTTLPCLYQEVLVSQLKEANVHSKGSRGLGGKSTLLQKQEKKKKRPKEIKDRDAKRSDDTPRQQPVAQAEPVSSRTGAGKQAVEPSALKPFSPCETQGSWQSIVAWVPASMGLPQTFQAIPPEVKNAITDLAQNPKGAMKTIKEPKNIRRQDPPRQQSAEMLTVVPGQVADSTHVMNYCDSLNSDDDASVAPVESMAEKEKKETFELLSSWAQLWKQHEARKECVCETTAGLDPLGNCKTCGLPRAEEAKETSSRELSRLQDAPEELHETKKCFCIIHPQSIKRIIWDLLSMVLIFYDVVVVPLVLFDIENWFLDTMIWVTRIFWTCDVFMSLTTAVMMKDGTISYDCKFIFCRYLRTWFLMDLIIVGADWAEVILEYWNVKVGTYGRITRSSRAVRCVRLLRLLRMKDVLEVVSERIQTDKILLLMKIIMMILVMIGFSHMTGCAYWGIGNLFGSDTDSWVRDGGYNAVPVTEQYLVSVHWSLSQIQGSNSGIKPMNSYERGFAVLMIVLAFILGALILSLITSSITQSHIIKCYQSQSESALRKFLKQNHVSTNLALRMQRCAQHAISGELSQDSVELLPLVSEPLKMEMHYEMYHHVLRCHCFLGKYVDKCQRAARQLCHRALRFAFFGAGDEIFVENETPIEPSAYFVVRGKLIYIGRGDTDAEIGEKTWLAEPCLWTMWVHQGTLASLNDAKVVGLSTEPFFKTCSHFPSVHEAVKQYSTAYVLFMNECASEGIWVNDLAQVPGPRVASYSTFGVRGISINNPKTSLFK